MRYLRELVMPHPVHKVLLEGTLKAVDEAGERVARLTELIEAQYLEWERRDWCEALMGLRGFGVLTAVTMVAEIGGPVLAALHLQTGRIHPFSRRPSHLFLPS